ncbi:MAG: amidohydrolase family protein [Bacteroidales bacterium]|nr:amidohydrolase family protein [Bacteroidales bacterium]
MKLLKGALIYDGTGSEPFRGDILIENDKITKVEESINPEDGWEVIELDGLSVSSGFIDAHSHNDWFAVKKEPKKYFEPFIRQGITSFVTGNCGLSAVGFEPDTQYVDKVGGGLFSFQNTTGVYPSVSEFFTAIDGNTPCNIAVLAGHCTARASVAGYENRSLNEEERKRMLDIMETALKEGACGLSLGLMYEPGIYAGIDELKEVAGLCEKYDRPMTVHPRACSAVSMTYPLLGRPHLLRALDELVEIAEGTRMKLHYSHAIFVGRRTFRCKDELLSILNNLQKKGVDIGFDIYSELLGVSVITVVLPAWYQSLSRKEKRHWFNKLKLGILIDASIALLGFGWDDIQIAYIGPGYEKYEGKTVSQIAKEMGKSCLDTYLDLCEISDFKGRVNMGPYSTPEIVSELSKDDRCLYMTDAWVEDYGVQNPAIYDCFPKFLKFSLEGTGDTMPATIRKMTGGVADRFSIKERGYVKPGYYADITVFNEEKLRNGQLDQEKSFGIEKVFINGVKVLDNEMLDAEAIKHSGRAMRS